MLGRAGIGIDLSPYAVTLIRAKARPSSPEQVAERIKAIEAQSLLVECPADIPMQVREFFHEKTLREIVGFRSALDPVDDVDNFVLALMCGILHGGRPGFLSRQTRDIIPLKPLGPAEHRRVAPRLSAKLRRVFSKPLPGEFKPGEAYWADSRDLSFLPEDSVDMILTSPPFFETTEFVRHNWLRLWLVGWSLDEQRDRAKQFIGEKAAQLDRFESDLSAVLAEAVRCLRPGGIAVVHSGKRKGDNMTEMILRFATSMDLTLLSVIDESVDHTRRHAIRHISGLSHEFVVLQRKSG